MVFVAFAGMGGTPVKSSAGNAIKLPPPATEFRAPPNTPAKKRKMADCRFKHSCVPESACDRQFRPTFLALLQEKADKGASFHTRHINCAPKLETNAPHLLLPK